VACGRHSIIDFQMWAKTRGLGEREGEGVTVMAVAPRTPGSGTAGVADHTRTSDGNHEVTFFAMAYDFFRHLFRPHFARISRSRVPPSGAVDLTRA